MHGMAVNLANLVSNLHTHPVLFISNCAHVVWEFLQKSYPHSWWMPVMRRIYLSQTDLPMSWNQFLDTLPWVIPCPPKYCLLQSTNLMTTISLTVPPSLPLVTGLLPPLIPLQHMEILIEKRAPITYLPRIVWYSYIFPHLPPMHIYYT